MMTRSGTRVQPKKRPQLQRPSRTQAQPSQPPPPQAPSQPGVVKQLVLFGGREEVITALTEKKPLFKTLLADHHDVCPFLGGATPEIKLIKRLGKGIQGAVFSVTIANDTKEYVVKRSELTQVDVECKTLPISQDSNLCYSQTLIEYIIGVILSPRYNSCVNFPDVFSLHVCSAAYRSKKPNLLESDGYTFMEKLDMPFDALVKYSEVSMESCVFQVLAGISYYQQEKFMIQHSDLHLGNVMCQKKENAVDIYGNSLADAKFFAYKLGPAPGHWDKKKFVYFPAGKLVAKIVDYGFAAKYSVPRVLNAHTYANRNAYIPYFTLWYDLLYFLGAIEDIKDLDLADQMLLAATDTLDIRDVRDYYYNSHFRPVHEDETTVDTAVRGYEDTAIPVKILKAFTHKVDSKKKLPEKTQILGIIEFPNVTPPKVEIYRS